MEITKANTDYLFITEVLNDLHQYGFVRGGKAVSMLTDWKSELRKEITFPKTRQKAVHRELCGPGNW